MAMCGRSRGVDRFVFSSAFTVTSDGGPSGGAEIYCAAGERGPWALIEGQKGAEGTH